MKRVVEVMTKKMRRQNWRETTAGRKKRDRYHFEDGGKRPIERKRTVGWIQHRDMKGPSTGEKIAKLMEVFPDTSKREARKRNPEHNRTQERARRVRQLRRGTIPRG